MAGHEQADPNDQVLRQRDRDSMGPSGDRTQASVAAQIGMHERSVQSHLHFIQQTESGGPFATPDTSTAERMNALLAHRRRQNVLRRYLKIFFPS